MPVSKLGITRELYLLYSALLNPATAAIGQGHFYPGAILVVQLHGDAFGYEGYGLAFQLFGKQGGIIYHYNCHSVFHAMLCRSYGEHHKAYEQECEYTRHLHGYAAAGPAVAPQEYKGDDECERYERKHSPCSSQALAGHIAPPAHKEYILCIVYVAADAGLGQHQVVLCCRVFGSYAQRPLVVEYGQGYLIQLIIGIAQVVIQVGTAGVLRSYLLKVVCRAVILLQLVKLCALLPLGRAVAGRCAVHGGK